MSKLAEFRELERTLAAQLAALEALKSDKGLEKEIEFETKLRDLMGQYGKSLRDIISMLDPTASSKGAKANAPAAKGTRRARTIKIYKNPHSGEVIETKGGNHKQLKQWKAEHGNDTVESWLSN